jgi:hypothetical protein
MHRHDVAARELSIRRPRYRIEGECSSACSVRPADARSVEVMKGGGEGRRWLLAGSGAAARAVD